MTNTNSNDNFLSQRILQQGTSIGSAPLLRPEQRSQSNDKIPNTTSYHVDNGRAEAGRWKIKENEVPQIPIYYALEPRSLTVKDIPVDVISKRIADFLRRHSISYCWTTEAPHPVHLQCCTSTMLKFVIQFWRPRPTKPMNGDPDNNNSSFIVELQRRQGSSIEMQRIRRAITREILYGEQAQMVPDFSTTARPHFPESILEAIDLDDKHHGSKEAARLVDAETICQDLLQSPCLDQFQLGLESLRMLCDPSIVSVQTAQLTSRAIIMKIHGGDFGDIVQRKLVECFARTSPVDLDVDDEMQTAMYGEGPCLEYAHNTGLAILGNALQVVVDDDGTCISDVVTAIDLNSNFWKHVTEHLIYDIERATQKPNEAAMSAKCIRLLNHIIVQSGQSSSSSNNNNSSSNNNNNTHFGPVSPSKTCLAQAFTFGRGCHLSLETETARLMAMEIDDTKHIYAH